MEKSSTVFVGMDVHNPRRNVIDPAQAGNSEPRARQLRDAQQSCG